MQSPLQQARSGTSSGPRAGSALIGPTGLAVAVGVAYFLAARLSLALLTKPDGVAVFWPAAGIAAGTLIALGPRARLPVVLGVVAATIVANLLGDRNFAAGVIFALCNAGEALLVAGLIQRAFGREFRLESLRSVVGFFAAAGIGAAISGIVATVGFLLFYRSVAPALTIWLNWFASDALGMIMVAPLLIGLGSLNEDLPQKRELLEGIVTLTALVVVSAIAFGAPAHDWYTVLPLGLLLPILLAAHCRPVFAASAALILGFAVVWTTTFGIGELGELQNLPDRVHAARATLLAISMGTLVLAALFAERRHKEVALEDANHRLQLALDGAELGVWSLDVKTGRFQSDARDRQIHGYRPDQPPETIAAARPFIHSADLPVLDAAFAGAKRTGARCKVEYRLAPASSGTLLSQERWAALEGTVVRDAHGQAVQFLGVTRNISDSKQAERELAERNLQLALAGKAARVGSYAYDTDTEVMQISEGYAAIHGFPEGTTEIARSQCLADVHPDDIRQVEQARSQAFYARRREYGVEYRINRAGVERWVETRCFISYASASDGRPLRVLGVSIDITGRKHMEQEQHQLVAELDHRVKNTLATVAAIIAQTQEGRGSLPDFVAALDGRIQALARTHDLLSRNHWTGVSLHDIVERELAPYASGNVEIDGPHVELKAEAAQAMAMVVHELATNAAKYGALSNRSGRVRLCWWWLRNGSSGRLAVEWREIDGPPVQIPGQTGYGMSIIRELVPFELNGKVDLALEAAGVTCRLELPPECLSEGRSPAPNPLPSLQPLLD